MTLLFGLKDERKCKREVENSPVFISLLLWLAICPSLPVKRRACWRVAGAMVL